MTAKLSILLLEDDRSGLAPLSALLPQEAYRVERVTGCADAVAALSRDGHDAALFDEVLPDGRGIEVVGRLAAMGRATPAILVTRGAAPDLAARAREVGAADCIARDEATPALLARVLRHAVERRQREAALAELRARLEQRELELEKVRQHAEAQNANTMKLAEHLAQAELKEHTAFIIAEERKQRYETLARHGNVGIWQLAPDGTTDFLNPAMCTLLEIEGSEAVRERPFYEFFQAEAVRVCRAELATWLDGGSTSFESEIVGRQTGKSSHVVISGSPLYGLEGEISQVLLTVIDITARKTAVETMRNMARRDALTGLFNRFVFQDRLLQATANAERIGRSVAVLYIDLDDFKAVNDTLGHQAGDELLQHVAGQIRTATRSSDTAARLGGDEFAVILTNLQTPEGALLVAKQILDRLEQPFRFEGQPVRIRASIGVTLFPQDGRDPERLLKNADAALYRAKGASRGGYQFYDPAFAQPLEQERAFEFELRAALERGQLVLHYQPQIDLRSGKVLGLEALLRWQSPERGLVYPKSIVPLAERSGLIVPIGEWVMNEACRQGAEWERAGYPPQRIAVNLSAGQLQAEGFVATVARALEASGLPAERLELEITESMVLEDIEQATAVLRELRALGVGVAMDDFGTGYSSLTYLKVFPVDQLKIDRSFVSRVPDEADNTAIVTATTVLGHSLNVRVVAEGVETAEQSAFLRTTGCDEAQGYYYCRPLPEAEIRAWLDAWGARPDAAAELHAGS